MENNSALQEIIRRLDGTGFIYNPDNIAIREILLGNPRNLPTKNIFSRVFVDDYEPGTFTLDERRNKPFFISVDDNASYEEWVIREASADLAKVLPALEMNCPWQLPSEKQIGEIPYKTMDIFEHKFDDGTRLTEGIYQQEYTDVFRRINLIFTTGWPRLPFNEYDAVNRILYKLGLEIVKLITDENISLLLKMSAAAGLVGLNHKTNASATSLIFKDKIIPVSIDTTENERIQSIYSNLMNKCNEKWAIDSENFFYKNVINTADSARLVFFPDDLFETIIDLKLMECLLQKNPRLNIFIIPRAVRAGNDASAQDVINLIREDVFSKLAGYMNEDRLAVIFDGPLSGNVNGRRMSSNVLKILNTSDTIFAKGARSFECLQGIKKDSFYGFSVCRSISESVTGVDAETGGLVLIHQDAGQKSYEGYRERHLRPVQRASGRKAWLSKITVLDHV